MGTVRMFENKVLGRILDKETINGRTNTYTHCNGELNNLYSFLYTVTVIKLERVRRAQDILIRTNERHTKVWLENLKWEPRRLTTLWAFAACYTDSFTFLPFMGEKCPPKFRTAYNWLRTGFNDGLH
jgi:hypothetical protein